MSEIEQANGIERIAAERQRQITEEGWTPEHDDGHRAGELAVAAACYAMPERIYVERRISAARGGGFAPNTSRPPAVR